MMSVPRGLSQVNELVQLGRDRDRRILERLRGVSKRMFRTKDDVASHLFLQTANSVQVKRLEAL